MPPAGASEAEWKEYYNKFYGLDDDYKIDCSKSCLNLSADEPNINNKKPNPDNGKSTFLGAIGAASDLASTSSKFGTKLITSLKTLGSGLAVVSAGFRVKELFTNLKTLRTDNQMADEFGDATLDVAFGMVGLVPGLGLPVSITYFVLDNVILNNSGGVYRTIKYGITNRKKKELKKENEAN